MRITPSPVAPRALVHQEAVLAIVAIVGLAFRDGGPLPALAPTAGVTASLLIGAAAGAAFAGVLYLLKPLPAVARLEAWLGTVVGRWDAADAAAVAVISGIAEEALLRALLQPLIGLLPAALLFALLHAVPDRRLWFWPLMALAAGLLFGLLHRHFGYPAAAVAHVVVNGASLLRLSRRDVGTTL